ncbi:MAG: hypothetical protein AAGL97_01245 [Pseudomonadota bacterium]
MADGAERSTAHTPLIDAERIIGTVYVIDLIGFSQITESQIAQNARSGTETVTRLVTDLFGQLMAELAKRGIRFGGFAGDALIAWQATSDNALTAAELETVTATICEQVTPELSCRTAVARDAFWVASVESGQTSRPLIWGPAVHAAFASLISQPRRQSTYTAVATTDVQRDERVMASASVSNRWTMIIQALTPEACRTTTPDQLAPLLQRMVDVCDAGGADIDNIVQDDKGLLTIITLAPSRSQNVAQLDQLIENFTSERNPIAHDSDIAWEFGTVFRVRPEIVGIPVTITIGEPINHSAKNLMKAYDRTITGALPMRVHEDKSERILIGRGEEAAGLWKSYERSKHSRQTATLTAPAGVGKSALVQSLAARIDGAPAIIEATPGSRLLPFGCAQDLAEHCGLPATVVFQPDGQAELARRVPPVIIIENWQWCDKDSKRLLRKLQDDRASGLMLVTSRTPVADIEATMRLSLAPLDAEQSAALIETLAPGQLDDLTKQSIFDVTSGTPFWLVQAALHYTEQNDGSETLSSTAGLDGLLAARGRELSEQAVALWRLYCAWRLPMHLRTARELLAKFNIDVESTHHEELTRLGWVVPDGPGLHASYRPAHDILADWGASDLPLTFERALNSAIARKVAQKAGSPSRIALHWQMAGRDLRAAVWFNRAAKYADRAGAYTLTIDHLERAARLYQDTQNRHPVKLLEHLALLATAQWGVGKLRRARQSLAEFDENAKPVPTSNAKRAALRRAATIQSEVGQFAGNSALIISGMLRGWQNSRGDADGYEVKARRQGFIYYVLGLMRLPVEGRLNRLTEKAHESGEYRSQALLGCSAATLHLIRCNWAKADSILTSCHAAIAETDDRQMLGVAQTLLGLCHLFQGEAETAIGWFERVAEIGRDQDHHMFTVWGAYARAEAYFYAGDFAQAKRLALAARAGSKGLGDHQSACIIEGLLAQLYLAEADDTGARKHARNAARFAAKLPPTNFSTLEGIAAPAQVGAELLRRTRAPDTELEAMIKMGRKALKSYAQVFKVAQPRRHYVEGLIARAVDDTKSARRHFRKARSLSATLGMKYEQMRSVSALQTIEE